MNGEPTGGLDRGPPGATGHVDTIPLRDDDPTRLLSQLACRDTVERAAHLADLPDPAGLAALFTEDAVLQRPSGDTLVGRAAIQAAYAARPAQRITRHLVWPARW